jgi:HEPN domain-containing protein
MPFSEKDPQYWIEIAGLDETSAEILHREGGPASISAYHYHQAAEKLLKGAILATGSMFPFVHDLRRLHSLLSQARPDLPNVEDSIDELQSAYRNLRYPHEGTIDAAGLERIRTAYFAIATALRPR